MKNNSFYMLYNIAVVAVFAVIAINFDKWWIVLFSLLFVFSSSTKYIHRIKCDSCGKSSKSASSFSEAREQAKAEGWKHYPIKDNGFFDICPDCASLYKEKPKHHSIDWTQTDSNSDSFVKAKPNISRDNPQPWKDPNSECHDCSKHMYIDCLECVGEGAEVVELKNEI